MINLSKARKGDKIYGRKVKNIKKVPQNQTSGAKYSRLEIKEQNGTRGVGLSVHSVGVYRTIVVHIVGVVGGEGRGRCPVDCSTAVLPSWRCVTCAYISARKVRYCKITG